METEIIKIKEGNTINVTMTSSMIDCEEVVAVAYGRKKRRQVTSSVSMQKAVCASYVVINDNISWNTENYSTIHENGFHIQQ